MKTSLQDIKPYETRDGSQIRELMHPESHPVRQQSLAIAIVAPGTTTRLHRHNASEELYHVTAGAGTMTLGSERFAIATGDTILIPPGAAHCVEAAGDAALHLLCCCSPAYAHDDTELL